MEKTPEKRLEKLEKINERNRNIDFWTGVFGLSVIALSLIVGLLIF